MIVAALLKFHDGKIKKIDESTLEDLLYGEAFKRYGIDPEHCYFCKGLK